MTSGSNTPLTGLLFALKGNPAVIRAPILLPSICHKAKASEKGLLANPIPFHFLEVSKAFQISPRSIFLVMSSDRHGWGGRSGISRACSHRSSTHHTIRQPPLVMLKLNILKLRLFFICLTFLSPSASDHYHA